MSDKRIVENPARADAIAVMRAELLEKLEKIEPAIEQVSAELNFRIGTLRGREAEIRDTLAWLDELESANVQPVVSTQPVIPGPVAPHPSLTNDKPAQVKVSP